MSIITARNITTTAEYIRKIGRASAVVSFAVCILHKAVF